MRNDDEKRNFAPERKHSSEYGFTLIELSIVLVLIGLVIGGVLKGQELIASTRLKMAVSQWDAVKASFNVFQDKYNALPGDYSQAVDFIDANLTNGNGNGVVGGAIGANAYRVGLGPNNFTTNEHRFVWDHLFRAGLISAIDNDDLILPSKISGAFFHVMYSTLGSVGNERTAHWLRLQSGLGVTARATSPLSPKEASEIDRKYDDGNAESGIIQAGPGHAAGTCTYSPVDTKECGIALEVM